MPTPRPGKALFRIRVRGADRRPGKHAYDVEMLVGDSEQADRSGVELFSLFDRRGDRRRERGVDPLTGRVLFDSDERLSDHEGHGAAKHQ